MSNLADITELDNVKGMIKLAKLVSKLKKEMPILRQRIMDEVYKRPLVLEERSIDGLRDALMKKFEDISEDWNLSFEKGYRNGVDFLCVKQGKSKVDNILDIWWLDDMIPGEEIKKYGIFTEDCQGHYFLQKPPRTTATERSGFCEICGKEYYG